MRLLFKSLIPLLLAQAVLAVTAQQHSAIQHSHAADPAETPAAPAAAADPCITAPSAAACSQYKYPQANAAADLSKLCSAMHFMSACSVSQACNASGAGPEGNPRGPGAAQVSKNNPDICDPFQHVTTVCKLDGMGRMSGRRGGNCRLVQMWMQQWLLRQLLTVW